MSQFGQPFYFASSPPTKLAAAGYKKMSHQTNVSIRLSTTWLCWWNPGFCSCGVVVAVHLYKEREGSFRPTSGEASSVGLGFLAIILLHVTEVVYCVGVHSYVVRELGYLNGVYFIRIHIIYMSCRSVCSSVSWERRLPLYFGVLAFD